MHAQGDLFADDRDADSSFAPSEKKVFHGKNGAELRYTEQTDGSLVVDFRGVADLLVTRQSQSRYRAVVPGLGVQQRRGKINMLSLLAVLRAADQHLLNSLRGQQVVTRETVAARELLASASESAAH